MCYICKFCGEIFCTTELNIKCPVCGEDYYLKKYDENKKDEKNEKGD